MSKKVLRLGAGILSVALLFVPGTQAIGLLGMKLVIGTGALLSMGVALADGEPLRPRRQLLGMPLPRVGMRPFHKRREWGRWGLLRASGECMAPILPSRARSWLLIDHKADIRPGDLIAFALRQHREFFVKRFTTWTDDGFDCETINPRQDYEIDRADVLWAYRVRAVPTSRWSALLAARRIVREPGLFDDRLAA